MNYLQKLFKEMKLVYLLELRINFNDKLRVFSVVFFGDYFNL